MLDVVELARRFIDIESITGNEGAMAAASAEVLLQIGFDARLLQVAPGRANVLATLDAPRVLLCTHLDTVPPHFPARDEGDWLHGRGACDTKGILAAMLGAAERLLQEGVRDVGLLLVVGEETDSVGAKHANATLSLPSVTHTVVGEPTELKFARAQKGAFKLTLRARGRAAHSGYPEHGHSALRSMLDLLQRIDGAEWGEDAELGRASVNVGVLRAGRAANVVPDEAEAEVFIRVVDSAAAVRQRVEQIVQPLGPSVEWREEGSNDPHRWMTLPGEPETVVAFNTDAPFLTRFGQRLLVGPGSILVAHSSEERISKRELHAAVDLYHRTVLHLRTAAG
jgi:acetylornithine deacetylase